MAFCFVFLSPHSKSHLDPENPVLRTQAAMLQDRGVPAADGTISLPAAEQHVLGTIQVTAVRARIPKKDKYEWPES